MRLLKGFSANIFQNFQTQFKGSGIQFNEWDLIFPFSFILWGFFCNFSQFFGIKFSKKLRELSFRIKVRVNQTFFGLSKYGELKLGPNTMKFDYIMILPYSFFCANHFRVYVNWIRFRVDLISDIICCFSSGFLLGIFIGLTFANFLWHFTNAKIYLLKVVKHKINTRNFSNFDRSHHVDFLGKVFVKIRYSGNFWTWVAHRHGGEAFSIHI